MSALNPRICFSSALIAFAVLPGTLAHRTNVEAGTTLQPPAGYQVAGSNMELVGSEADRALRKQVAETEAAWHGCGQQVGVEIWRIEQFEVKKWEQYGSFYEGDSYIVLHTWMQDEAIKHTIYFWLGSGTTLDEQGTAAYKVVELDAYFDDEPQQVRVEQGSEPESFMQLFPDGLVILSGGTASGFRHAEPSVYSATMWQSRKYKSKAMQMPVPWKSTSFNPSDSFVLDAQNEITVVHGVRASSKEKYMSATKAHSIHQARFGTPIKWIELDEGEDFCASLTEVEPPIVGCS